MDSETNDYPCPFLKYGFTDKLRKLTFFMEADSYNLHKQLQ